MTYPIVLKFILIIICIKGSQLIDHSKLITKDVPQKLCYKSSLNQSTELSYSEESNSYVCSGIKRLSEITKDLPQNVTKLTIVNSTILVLSESELKGEPKFKSLLSLSINDSFFNLGLKKWIHRHQSIEELSFHNCGTTIKDFFQKKNITTVDVGMEEMQNLKVFNISSSHFFNLNINEWAEPPKLYIKDCVIDCAPDYIWLLERWDANDDVVIDGEFTCFVAKEKGGDQFDVKLSLNMFNFSLVMGLKLEARENCPVNCSCALIGIMEVSKPQMYVDCVGLNLTELPKVIPRGTSRCNFSYNFIKDMSIVYDSPFYSTVTMMVLSYNFVSYVDPEKFPKLLSGKDQVAYFLDRNRIEVLPTKPLLAMYKDKRERRAYTPNLVLGGNPFICSCDFIGSFQELLYQFSYEFGDMRNIRCWTNDLPNPNGHLVYTLDVNGLCKSPEILLDPLDIINILLFILFIILMVDFVYNYHQYKNYRRLPWIITKFKC